MSLFFAQGGYTQKEREKIEKAIEARRKSTAISVVRTRVFLSLKNMRILLRAILLIRLAITIQWIRRISMAP